MKSKFLFGMLLGIVFLSNFVSADIVVIDFEEYYFGFLSNILFIALPITILVEFGIIWLFIRKNPFTILAYSALINVITLPLANYGYFVLSNFFLIEALVILAESILVMFIFQLRYKRSLLISFVANFVTALLSFGSLILSNF